MGVGIELLGKHVRCPHCKQVVLAPTTVGVSPANPPAPPPPPVKPPAPTPPTARPSQVPAPGAAPKPHEAPAPVFKMPQREAADSILGDPEESEDDVFGAKANKRPAVPQMPDAPPPPPSGPISTMVLPTPFPTLEATDEPTGSAAAAPAAPARPAPAAPVPPPAPVPALHAAGPANPWAGLDAMAAPSAPAPAPVTPVPVVVQPAPVPRTPEPEEPEEEPRESARPLRGRAAPVSRGVPKGVVYALAVYALVMTGLAVYGLIFKTATLPADHPLSTIPDNFGEFPPAERKKASATRFPVDGALPASQKAAIGGKIEVGQLEIVPVQIEKRKLTIVREGEKRPVEVPAGEGLVLRLRVKNTSSDLPIYPLDPAFQRRETADDTPASRLVVGKETFVGGPITWPFVRTTREYEKEQEAETRPLLPGETREYVVCSPANPRIFEAVKYAKESSLWRVQVRRGLIDFHGKNVPVTAIIGVEFQRADVPGL
jgi:hypothetical protein